MKPPRLLLGDDHALILTGIRTPARTQLPGGRVGWGRPIAGGGGIEATARPDHPRRHHAYPQRD